MRGFCGYDTRLFAGEGRIIRYEGYGPGGSAVIVDCLSQDSERTVAEVRRVFAEHDGHLGAHGSVAYLFKQVGLMTYPPGTARNRVNGVAVEAGAEEIVAQADGSIAVLTDPVELNFVRSRLVRAGWPPATAGLTWRSSVRVPVTGEAAHSLVRLVAALEALDDVQSIYTNGEIPGEVLARV